MSDTQPKTEAQLKKSCKWCKQEIPKDALRCQHCHGDLRTWTQRHQILALILGLIFLFVLIKGAFAYLRFTSGLENNNSTSSDVLQLESLSFSTSASGDYAVTEGLVKNISSEPQSDIVVEVQLLDANGDFVKSDSGSIKYDPLLPGQESAFKIMTSYNPAMKSGTVEFRKRFGGKIPTSDSTK